MFLVFRKSGKIVHKENCGRFNGDFTPVDFGLPLKPESPMFDVDKEGVSGNGKPWLRLKLRPAPSIRPGKAQA